MMFKRSDLGRLREYLLIGLKRGMPERALVRMFETFFVYLFVYYVVLYRDKILSQFALMKLYNIRVLLNRAKVLKLSNF